MLKPITREQREAVYNLWTRSPTAAQAKVNRLELELEKAREVVAAEVANLKTKRDFETYRVFRRRWRHHFDGFIGAEWCGMFIGIEKDGYTHS